MSAAAECVVIGGGLAGAMAGLRLAQARRDVLLIEKERGAHAKVCGEFLSPEAIGYLRAAGVDPVELGAAAITGLRVAVGAREVAVELPFAALSLSRTVLDEALLKRAAEVGCRMLRGIAVERLTKNGVWNVQLGDDSTVRGENVFLATGKHNLRGWARSAGRQNDLVGFKVHWRLASAQTAALRSWMDLFLFRGGYGGLALVEDGIANLCMVVRREDLRQVGSWEKLLSAIVAENCMLRERLEDARALWPKPLAIAGIPYGYLAKREIADFAGLWPLGDQAAVIPSFTGDGMSIALHSAALAAECFLRGETVAAYLGRLSGQLRGGMALATSLSRWMVTAAGRKLAPAVLAMAPGALGAIAERTRIPAACLMGEKGDAYD